MHTSRTFAAILLAMAMAPFTGTALAQGMGAPADTSAALSLYIAVDGDDGNTGRSPATAVRTLDRIQALLRAIPEQDRHGVVAVRFRSGTYHGLGVDWTYWRPGTDIVFEPEHPDAEGYPVVLDGSGGTRPSFFTLSLVRGDTGRETVPTRLHFRRLRVTNYCEGISFGDWRANVTVSDNSISESRFDHIGSKFDPVKVTVKGQSLPQGKCVAAVRLQHAHQTVISKNIFRDIENLPAARTAAKRYGPGHLHAIYISSESMHTLVKANRFERYNGPPVRIRDRSDGTRVVGNHFLEPSQQAGKAGAPMAAVSQWYCNTEVGTCVDRADAGQTECPSSGIEIHDNVYSRELILYADQSQSTQATCAVKTGGAAPVYTPVLKNNVAR